MNWWISKACQWHPKREIFILAKVEGKEHPVKVHARKKTDEIIRAVYSECLLRGNLVFHVSWGSSDKRKIHQCRPVLSAVEGIWVIGLYISRKNMASWTVSCADRHLAILWLPAWENVWMPWHMRYGWVSSLPHGRNRTGRFEDCRMLVRPMPNGDLTEQGDLLKAMRKSVVRILRWQWYRSFTGRRSSWRISRHENTGTIAS